MDVVEQKLVTRVRELDDAGELRRSLDEPARFRIVFERHHDRVRRYVVSRIGPDAADDVVADTFVEAFRSRKRFDHAAGTDAAPWLLGIATNMLARHRASERRWIERCSRVRVDRDDASFDDDVASRLDANSRRARLVAAVTHLPERERAALLLHVLGGCSYEEVAEATGVPLGTVRSRISRGRARLLERIEAGERHGR